VLVDQIAEMAPGNVAQDLVKHAIVVRHGLIPCSCSDFAFTRTEAIRINAVAIVQGK
jgi:hypothetical protein